MSKASRLKRQKAEIERGKPVKPYLGSDGYLHVDLQRPNGDWESPRLHDLVAATFNGPCPEGMEAYHLNGDVTDCSAANLSYRVATKRSAP